MSTRVRLRDETGLSLYEVLVAILVLVVGMMGVYVSIGTTNGAVAAGEKTAVIAQAAQQQLENVEALPYASIANSSDPQQTSTTDSSDPTYYLTSCVSGTCSSYYAGLSKKGIRRADRPRRDERQGRPGLTKQVVADPERFDLRKYEHIHLSNCRLGLHVYH